MVICVDDSLKLIYNGLRSEGYDVCMLSEGIDCDIAIYSGGERSIVSLKSSLPEDKGVFIINGDNKSCSEIIDIIKNRSYSSLF